MTPMNAQSKIDHLPAVSLLPGESAIDAAPYITLPSGGACIPQHYLRYAHTRASVEAVVADIAYDSHFPIFVSEDAGGLFIQIGIVGFDNYGPQPVGLRPKIVFGRRWRVEPNLPTSEIIQTVFLALKKAREHEVRERFTLHIEGGKTTPFNNHHDLPVMAREADSLHECSGLSASDAIAAARYSGEGFTIKAVQTTPMGATLYHVIYDGTSDFIPEAGLEFLISVKDTLPQGNAVLRGLVGALLVASDAHVDAHFTYQGFARFADDVDTVAIASLSRASRRAPERVIADKTLATKFAQNFEAERYETDSTRIPALGESDYAARLRTQLAELNLSNYALVCGPR